MVALVAATSALEMLSDLLPVSSLNSQDKLPRGKRRCLRKLGTRDVWHSALPLSHPCLHVLPNCCPFDPLRIAALVAQTFLMRTGGTHQHGKLSY